MQKEVYDQWNHNGTGPLATNGIEAGVKIRPSEQELKEMGPEFRDGWDSYFKNKPDKPVMHYSLISGYKFCSPMGLDRDWADNFQKLRFFGDHMLLPPGKFFSMFHFLEYPFSRGSIHIVSPNPYEAPDFDAGFMNDRRDMAPMVWAYKKSRETARRMDCFAGEVHSMHPHFAYDSPARCLEMDLETTKAFAGPNHLTAGIQHGSWARPLEK